MIQNNKKQRIYADILSLNKGIIIHPVGTTGKIHGGFSNKINERYPEQIDMYSKHCDKAPSKLALAGEIMVTPVSDKLFIFHSFFMECVNNRNRYINSIALNQCLDKIKTTTENNSINSIPVYFPYKMGAGSYGGDWNQVEKEICQKLPLARICIIPKNE